jgi:molybdate transport system permease protein
VQAFDTASAGVMSALLLLLSVATLGLVYALSNRMDRRA